MTVKMKTTAKKIGGNKYQIKYKIKGKSKWKKKTFAKKKVVIKKLKKGKRYKARVRAFLKAGKSKTYGAWSKTKTSKKIK